MQPWGPAVIAAPDGLVNMFSTMYFIDDEEMTGFILLGLVRLK